MGGDDFAGVVLVHLLQQAFFSVFRAAEEHLVVKDKQLRFRFCRELGYGCNTPKSVDRSAVADRRYKAAFRPLTSAIRPPLH